MKAMEANGDRLHKYEHEIADLEPGIDGTTTQERQDGSENIEAVEQDQVSRLFFVHNG